MKFCKKYEEYREAQDKGLAWVDCKKLEKILESCTGGGGDQVDSGPDHHRLDQIGGSNHHRHSQQSCFHRCPVCDGAFFPAIHEEMSAVVGCFNKRAQKLIQLHLASGVRKYFMWAKGKLRRNHIAMIQQGKDLVTYALINAIAVRKILKKYDKIHYSKQGQAFKSQAQNMQIEILQSPWLRELVAFHINSRQAQVNSKAPPALFEGFSLTFIDDKPSLSCELFESFKLDIELTCSICLDTIFDPVSLGCGHMFCYMCACSAASVSIVDGLKAADPKHQCPLCRQRKVYADAVPLKELNILLSQSCPEYWEKRRQSERLERVRQAKEHWESMCRSFMGV